MVGGLELKHVDGEWISAVPVAGTVLVNVGELLENISGKFCQMYFCIALLCTNTIVLILQEVCGQLPGTELLFQKRNQRSQFIDNLLHFSSNLTPVT